MPIKFPYRLHKISYYIFSYIRWFITLMWKHYFASSKTNSMHFAFTVTMSYLFCSQSVWFRAKAIFVLSSCELEKRVINQNCCNVHWSLGSKLGNIKMSAIFLNSSDAGNGIFRLSRWISYLMMLWLLKSPKHQHAWYWLCWTGNMHCSSRVNFINLGHAKLKIRFRMQICPWKSLKQSSMLRVKLMLLDGIVEINPCSADPVSEFELLFFFQVCADSLELVGDRASLDTMSTLLK